MREMRLPALLLELQVILLLLLLLLHLLLLQVLLLLSSGLQAARREGLVVNR